MCQLLNWVSHIDNGCQSGISFNDRAAEAQARNRRGNVGAEAIVVCAMEGTDDIPGKSAEAGATTPRPLTAISAFGEDRQGYLSLWRGPLVLTLVRGRSEAGVAETRVRVSKLKACD